MSRLENDLTGAFDRSHGRTAPLTNRKTEDGSSDTTRYLCAAAYLDRGFCNKVLDEIFEESHRFTAPSFGVDVVQVVKHCLAANRLNRTLDWVMIAALAIVFLPVPESLYPRPIYFLLIGLKPLIAFCGAWAYNFWDDRRRRHVIIARRLSKRSRSMNVDVPLSEEHRLRLEELEDDEASNLIIFAGSSPFVGSGQRLEGWSFVVNASRPKTGELGVTPFSAADLQDHVHRALKELGLGHFTVTDTLFVSGQDIRHDTRFLPDPYARPYRSADPKLVRASIGLPSHSFRTYLTMRVVDWKGELVLSVFIRFHRVRWNLFVEASYFVLPSLKSEYRAVDGFTSHPSLRQNYELVKHSFFNTIVHLISAPIFVIKDLWTPVRNSFAEESHLKEIRENPLFDYGATTSIREAGASNRHARYFQRMDKDMYVKIIEHRLLEEITAFLDKMNVDTGEVRQQSQVILNNGVMVTGGKLDAQSVAAGTGAVARAKNVVETVRKVTGN